MQTARDNAKMLQKQVDDAMKRTNAVLNGDPIMVSYNEKACDLKDVLKECGVERRKSGKSVGKHLLDKLNSIADM
jgi:hypothetical protein